MKEKISGLGGMMFAQRSERKENLGEGLEVMPVKRGPLKLIHAAHAVAMDSAEPEKRALVHRQRTEDVVRRADGHIRIGGAGIYGEEARGVRFGLAHAVKAGELAFGDDFVVVGHHAIGKREREEAFGVARIGFQDSLSARPCLRIKLKKSVAERLIGRVRNAAKEFLVVEKIRGRENALAMELFVEITRRLSRFADRVAGVRGLEGREIGAGGIEAKLIKFVEAGVKLSRVRRAHRYALVLRKDRHRGAGQHKDC